MYTNKFEYPPIFLSSSDAYSDLWQPFFDLFSRYWPEYKGIIYLNSELKDFHYDGLDIRCTRVGINSFGKTFRLGLDQIDTPELLLIMIDYFFMGPVNNQLVYDYFNYFKLHNLDSLCLIANPYTKTKKLNYKDLYEVIPPSKDMFSFQIAFWKKSQLYEMALPHETPWLSEYYGTQRANKMKLKLAYAALDQPIPYLAEGALHKGKWVKPIVNFLKEINYTIDFDKRGFFKDNELTLKHRLKGRLSTFWLRCLSNLDLRSRKKIK